ncbi:EamA family transporter [Candidatus Woesearchaeota archaeon]|nr:MAG: hypothetical protein QS99_C0016G0032 [archaeon GW2011_AR4]MBS3130147.1 EamA family transporter [Candidatus Woesearchaeota archaeon]HIH38978.1 EamA family transporter [Candidatus Woesearchaeota archaeon]HIH49005.1 EamA family transporter [Candidatus Woesearchaeota archaeon]HIJ04104.1 EamA family transporter [Candidatus Woesearchaeota archaeon]
MQTKPAAILLIIITTLFTSIAQVLWKFGANKLQFTFLSIITNYQIWLGFLVYAVAALLLVLALKQGELSVLYPVIATSYLWVSLLSIYYFHETITTLKWAGILLILIGVTTIGFGSTEEAPA